VREGHADKIALEDVHKRQSNPVALGTFDQREDAIAVKGERNVDGPGSELKRAVSTEPPPAVKRRRRHDPASAGGVADLRPQANLPETSILEPSAR
jgi:hypothetical protein